MRTMVVMIGIQGSGKSEFYKQYLSDHYIRVNLDTLHTRNKERLMIDQCIANSESFAIDNTNPTVADRAKYITAAKTAGYHIIGYFMQSMLMYGKEASNRKQEIDRQHYTIPNQRPKDKHCGKI